MSKDSVVEALRALATSDDRRSETARLRDVFDEVEGALNAGVSRAAILETLHGQGFTMTAKSFESALYRLRKRRMAGEKIERVHAFDSSVKPERVHVPKPVETPKEDLRPTATSVTSGGKSRTDNINEAPTKNFSLKQLQKEMK